MLDITDPVIQRLYNHILSDGGKWPLQSEVKTLKEINTWVAFRDSDKDRLKEAASWDEKRTTYRIDPLPERISDTWAAYLFGDEPRFQAPVKSVDGDGKPSTPDQPLLEALLEISGDGSALQMASELERAAGMSSSEGEVWSRIFVDKAIADRPLLEWHSRLSVLPLWVGSRLLAAALWTEMPDPNPKSKAIWRHFEMHAPGIVFNVLFKGNANSIGARVDLQQHPRTATIDVEEWRHGLPEMLMARIPNKLRGNPQLGISDYKGIKDYLLDLNETQAIGAVNARLSARKRAVITSSAAEQNDRGSIDGLAPTPEEPSTVARRRIEYDAAEDVYVQDPIDAELGKGAGDPFRILEYSFDAEALIKWKQEIVDSAITRSGLVAQYVGTNDQTGYAITGTAIRLRLIPTDKTGRSKGRYFDDGLPRIIGNMARIDALKAEEGGFGRPWDQPDVAPKVERRPGIPVDELEEAQRHGILISNGLESTRTGVKALHQDWPDDRVDEEVALINDERKAATPGATGSLFGV